MILRRQKIIWYNFYFIHALNLIPWFSLFEVGYNLSPTKQNANVGFTVRIEYL